MQIKITARDVNGEDRTIELDSENSTLPLLDELENKGVALAYGCRAGSCGVCRVRIVAGAGCLEERGFVEDDTWQRCGDDPTVRLACQAVLKRGTHVDHIVLEPAPEINPIED